MNLGIDTNILRRCVFGYAMPRIFGLLERAIAPCTTEHNADELVKTLMRDIRMSDDEALDAAMDVLSVFTIVGEADYAARRSDADRRLGKGGKSDWPLLAAAIQFEWPIWSDDTDFFGVGVPIWSTYNINVLAAA